MTRTRPVNACENCRRRKQSCDRAKPVCGRCRQTGTVCSFNLEVAEPGNSGSTILTPSTSNLNPVDSPTQQTRPTSASSPGGSEQIGSEQTLARALTKKKKRNRACLSCVRCHRHKVKCDKKFPCSRCKSTGFADHCSYTHRSVENSPLQDFSFFTCSGEDPSIAAITWHSHHRGSSHWKAPLQRIWSLGMLNSPPLVIAVRELACDAWENTPKVLSGNFPLGSAEAAKFTTADAMMALIRRTRPVAPEYLHQYRDSLEPLHPMLLDIEELSHEAAERLVAGTVLSDLSWLAQYLMVLGLGCFVGEGLGDRTRDLYGAAEACLAKIPYTFRPNIYSLRTLCLMVVAKRATNATCWAIDSSWSLMGLIVRLAVMVGLHQDDLRAAEDAVSLKDRRARRYLWTAILFIDIEGAAMAGMPPLLQRDVVGPRSDWSEPGREQDLLYSSYQTILDVVGLVNTNPDRISYEQVLSYDSEVRLLMSSVTASSTGLRRIALDIFFRRALISLHRQFAYLPDAPSRYPISYWSSLECSLAFLSHQLELHSGGRHAPQKLDSVTTVFMTDFFSATLTACIHLLWHDAPLAPVEASILDSQIPPRRTILDTLRSCVEIWSAMKDRSLCCRTGYRILELAMGMIPQY
ncbi:hypothetical protein MFIFM68171_08557 [Madurella fahalii]|uniref:Zn(2)-C6 fungal-type domain-containing protein n=1 Tax=Madurella fahalii TaxID=1157608 RepID=A0ABQ0GKQ3_9PEZI